MYLEELHGGNKVEEKIESLLLGVNDVLTAVQLAIGGSSRNTWSKLNEVSCLSSTLSPESG